MDRSPFEGRRVLITRAAEQASETATKLRDRGASPIEIPTIVIERPEDRAPLLDAARDLSRWDLVALTSPNAVDALVDAMREVGTPPSALADRTLAAIGPSTERALERHGLRADLVPRVHRGEALADAIVARRPKRVLLPRAAVAREVLPDRLRDAGIPIDAVVAYRSRPPGPSQIATLRDALAAGVDVVLFTSGSTVDNLCALLDDAPAALSKTIVASIGPVTTESCRARGVRVDVEAAAATLDELLAAIERFFSQPKQ
jgi:uroporphyrinogen III methyltransferase/synthase